MIAYLRQRFWTHGAITVLQPPAPTITMLYITEAFLLGQGLAFSRHSAVHAAFGEHFVKTGVVPSEFHRYLIRGMEVRHASPAS